jgi:hypothetical protein
MSPHVDVLQNDWVAAVQRRVAWFGLNGGNEIAVGGPEAEKWRRHLLHPVNDSATGQSLDPTEAPKDWLMALPEQVQGSYVVLVGPHEDEECSFSHLDEVPMEAD